jgi:hypothetical protein
MNIFRNFGWVGLVVLVLSLSASSILSTSQLALAQDEGEDSSLSILFDGDEGFDEFVDLTESKTSLSGDEWVTEFEKQTKFGDFRSSVSDLSGDYFLDALTMAQLFEEEKDFIFYGLFTFPADYPANSTEESIERGVVTFLTDDSLAIVLIDLDNAGELYAFIVFDRVENHTSALPSLNLESFLSVAFLLEALPNLPANLPGLPVPSPTDELLCSDELNKVRDLNLTLDSEQSIVKLKDSSDEDLYEIRVGSPNLLIVESFSKVHRVDATFNEAGRTRLIIFANTRTEDIELSDGIDFLLNVTAENSRTCISGTAELIDGEFKISGELHSN